MSKISMKNGKLYIDDKEFEMSGVRQLSDDELMDAVGGGGYGPYGTRVIYEKYGVVRHLKCVKCKCEDQWAIKIGSYNVLVVTCRNCGRTQLLCLTE